VSTLNIVSEVAIHPELLRCRSASGAHVLKHAARRFSLRLAFRAAPNFIDYVFNFPLIYNLSDPVWLFLKSGFEFFGKFR
jgi:hypothetical protein